MIDINMYGVPKHDDSNLATVSQIVLNQGGDGSNFEPHYIWGQLFTDKEDIDGDMKVNGFAYIDHIKTLSVDSENVNSSYIDAAYITAQYAKANQLTGAKLDFEWASIVKGYINDLATKNITTENLTVTKSAHFFELIIDQVKAAGGAVLFTPANGFTVRKVDKITDGYRLYFLAEDKGTKIDNMWKKNDQAICQNFNMGGEKKYQYTEYAGQRRALKVTNSSNKYYWVLVINTNNDDNNGEPININVGTIENVDMQPCHYVDISDNDYEGYLEPNEGDEIAMLGYRGNDDIERQNAIYISAYQSLDTDLRAPLFVQYKGINDFNLASHKYTWFSGGLTPSGIERKVEANEIRGSLKLTDGKTVDDKLGEVNKYISEVSFNADENYMAIKKINGDITNINGQLENQITWSYIKQHADEINMQVIEGLKQTGIDIKSGQITMNADMTKFLGSISMYNSDNGIALYDDNNKPRIVINRERLNRNGIDYLPNNMENITKQKLDFNNYYKLGDYYTQTKSDYRTHYYNKIQGYFLGQFNTSDSFRVHLNCTIRFANQDYDKGVYDIPCPYSGDTGVYRVTYKVYCGSTTIKEETIDLNHLRGIDFNVNCNVNGNYYLEWTIDYAYDINKVANLDTYYTIGEYFDCYITKSTQGLTFIGMNGLYSSQNGQRYMVYSDDGFRVTEKEPRNITIGDNNHTISNVYYSMGLHPEYGPYWNYGEGSDAQGESLSWAVPMGVPKLITLSENDFTNQTILDDNGQEITVKGYNVNANIYTMIRVDYLTENVEHYIILPYAEPAQAIIYNYSSQNVFVYARNTGNNNKNIYINSRKLNRNTGQWRYELEQTDECLWMIGDRYGWNNLSLIDR